MDVRVAGHSFGTFTSVKAVEVLAARIRAGTTVLKDDANGGTLRMITKELLSQLKVAKSKGWIK